MMDANILFILEIANILGGSKFDQELHLFSLMFNSTKLLIYTTNN